jgi:hypothetical protein
VTDGAGAATSADRWSAQDVSIEDIERSLARLRAEADPGSGSNLRTSVMTHMAWVPVPWLDAARSALAGLVQSHPSRTLLLVPHPEGDGGRIDAAAFLDWFEFEGQERHYTEVIELHLCGGAVHAPASVVLPLLISDLPVFLRWRGQPPFDTPEFEQLVGVADRLIVDSTEWPDLPQAYAELAKVFPHAAASDIAWARTGRWRQLLASLWPGIAQVDEIKVTGTLAQANLIAGWLRARLQKPIALQHEPAERLEGIDLDGEPAPFPPGDPPTPSDLLSDELDTYTRDRVYEEAVAHAVM